MTANHYRDPEERKKLYKNPDNAKIFGICSGLAEYFGLETWVVRIIAVSLLIFINGTVILAYIVMNFILDPKPGSVKGENAYGNFGCRKKNKTNDSIDAESTLYEPTVGEVWKASSTPKEMFQALDKKFSKIEGKLQNLESYVTSNQFELEKEFSQMEK